jgi:hypothetical protein
VLAGMTYEAFLWSEDGVIWSWSFLYGVEIDTRVSIDSGALVVPGIEDLIVAMFHRFWSTKENQFPEQDGR